MLQIHEIILNLFAGQGNTRYLPNREPVNPKLAFMKVPINQEVFELPTMVVDSFGNDTWNNNFKSASSLVITLNDYGVQPRYTTLDRNLRDTLLSPFDSQRLVRVEVKQNNVTIPYFVTRGAIFDEDYNPMMMTSLKFQKQNDDDFPYKLIKCIIRISPSCYLYKTDPMRRAIINKIVNKTAGIKVKKILRFYNLVESQIKVIKPIIEIADSPFEIVHPQKPTSSTSKEDLIAVALNNMNEVLSF